MRYLLIEFEEEEYWLEVGTDGYALRQIVVDNNKNIHVSCFEDCLAEGTIDEKELEGTINIIKKNVFDQKWQEVTVEKRKLWEIQKKKYTVGKEIEIKVEYHYPQGWILKEEDLIGICNSDLDLSYGQWVTGRIVGYDETNMWIRIAEIKID